MAENLNDLKNKREEILKAETVGYFSLFADKVLLESWKSREQIKNFPSSLIDKYDKDSLKKEVIAKLNISGKNIEMNEYKENLEDLVGRTGKGIFWNDCERINSGIEKGNPDSIEIDYNDFGITSIFGKLEKKFCIGDVLNKRDSFLSKLDISSDADLIDFKYTKDFKNVEDILESLPSDSRLSVADVSLWAQTYLSVSLYKARLAGIAFNAENSNNRGKWSILAIIYDKLYLKEQADKLGYILGIENLIDEVDEKIKKLIEYDYPLGNEIYRDETGIYFLVSGYLYEKNDEINNFEYGRFKNFHNELEEKINKIFNETFGGEILSQVILTKPSRGILTLGELKKNINNFLQPIEIDYDKLEEINRNLEEYHGLCKICKVRLFEEKKLKVCKNCKKKYEKPIESWLKEEQITIWLDELKDENNSIALVNISFDLNEWLNGELVNSFIQQKKEKNKLFELQNAIKSKLNDKINTINEISDLFDKALKKLPLKLVSESLLFSYSLGNTLQNYLHTKLSDKIDFENPKINWSDLTDDDLKVLAEVLFQILTRKHPSPGRIYRIWQATENFIKDIEEKILKKDILLFDRKEKILEEISKSLEDEFGRKLEDLTHKSINEIIKNYPKYFAYRNILQSPITCQFIIPANKVEEVLKKIDEFYDKHFKLVKGKLPLKIGIIIQNYKFPLYLGIKALRGLRDSLLNKENEFIPIGNNEYYKIEKNKLNNNLQEKLFDYISYFPNKTKTDYEFIIDIESCKESKSGDKVKLSTENKDKCVVFNLIDWEILDSNQRRYDIAKRYLEKDKKEDDIKDLLGEIQIKSQRPYEFEKFLDDVVRFQKIFENNKSKLQKLISILLTKYQDWQVYKGENKLENDGKNKGENVESFEKFFETTCKNILGKRLENDVKEIIRNYDVDCFKKLYNLFNFVHQGVKKI